MENWLKTHEKGTVLKLYIAPGASKDELSGIHGDRLKIKIKAPPRDGEANEGLIKFLSDLLKIPKKKIFLIQGESSRQKDVLVELSAQEIISILGRWIF
jgi:uncharacterized protein (TIGR00251 family)